MNGNDRLPDSRPDDATSDPQKREPSEEQGGALDGTVQASIGGLLRQHYAGLVAEPLPPSLVRLWETLEKKEREPGKE